MPPKKRPPAPIDRPLSKAYLREFSGWSTAYSPGISEPNSLRDMRNVMITREGTARIRPGLRSLLRTKSEFPLVGSFELFYSDEGVKSYLVAVRNTAAPEAAEVEFRVITYADDDAGISRPVMLTLDEAGFALPYGEPAFSRSTTYVKYLQIDNKIFALSNSPEAMIMFWVGVEKKAKQLTEIVRPDWTPEDKLLVRHPDAAWIKAAPSKTRYNLMENPGFEQSAFGWHPLNERTRIVRRTKGGRFGDFFAEVTSKPLRTNLCLQPLHAVDTVGIEGWWCGPNTDRVEPDGNALRISSASGNTDVFYALTSEIPVDPGDRLQIAFNLETATHLTQWKSGLRFYDVNDEAIGPLMDVGSGTDVQVGRKVSQTVISPERAVAARLFIGGLPIDASAAADLRIKDVFFGAEGDTSPLDGSMRPDFFWVGEPGKSASVHHPPVQVGIVSDRIPVDPAVAYSFSAYGKSPDAVGTATVALYEYPAGTNIPSVISALPISVQHDWVRTGLVTATTDARTVQVEGQLTAVLARGQAMHFDGALLELNATAGGYFSGDYPVSTKRVQQAWLQQRQRRISVSTEWAADRVDPPAETPTAATLIGTTGNSYNFGFFYTVANEIGESAPSQTTIVKTQRMWSDWKWQTPNDAGEPSGTATADPDKCADQLGVVMPRAVFDAAIAAGAVKWSAYMYTWGPNDVPPVTAMKFAEIPLDENSIYEASCFAVLTPQQVQIGSADPLVPSEESLMNSTDPSRGSQGIVAADRLVLVGDPEDPARIVWSSGQIADYHNFSPLYGGGEKTLATGNIAITGCVKLWQNPQSVDTLTILNLTDDGRSNAIYMQPAQITSMSEAISIMGFEETSGMEGTSSPYGCEVVNNALYHPLETSVVKSTANNYNLSHKPVTDDIYNMWRGLQKHRRIVSCSHDNRIYYLVHNPQGHPLQQGCWGNEIWVLDVGLDTPTWSRWLVQGISLRTVDVAGVVYVAVVHPSGLFMLDGARYTDESFTAADESLLVTPITWYLETNTQGANRAHDAWAHLQQLNLWVGNFQGQLRYGIKGQDVHGTPVHVEKVLLATQPPWNGLETVIEETVAGTQPSDVVGRGESGYTPSLFPWDREDYLLVQKTMKEWTFFAGSVDVPVLGDVESGSTSQFSSGQINLVQYRYAPVSVNVGYEYGSPETFEYGSSSLLDATTDSGVPKPYIDLGRP